MTTQRFSLRRRLKSIQFALQGLSGFFSSQHNAIVHAVATAAVVFLSLLVKLPLSKFPFVLLAIGLVWMAELFNSAIELLCDLVCPQQHPQIKLIKDLAAAAVLVMAITAVLIAGFLFIPYL